MALRTITDKRITNKIVHERCSCFLTEFKNSNTSQKTALTPTPKKSMDYFEGFRAPVPRQTHY